MNGTTQEPWGFGGGNGNGNKKDGWSTGEKIKCADKCSFAQTDAKPIIVIEQNVYAVIRRLCMEVKTEWQMLLIGDETHHGIVVHDYYIPKQEVGWAHVKNLDCITADFIREKSIIAGIHSHADMAPFFSPTDEESTNQSLIKNNIVINNRMESKAVMRKDLPCGMSHFQEAIVEFYFPQATEVTGLDNIVKKVYATQGFLGHGKRGDEAIDRLDNESFYVPPEDADFPLEQNLKEVIIGSGYGHTRDGFRRKDRKRFKSLKHGLA